MTTTTGFRAKNSKEIQDSRATELNDYLVIISQVLQTKLSAKSPIPVTLDFEYTTNNLENTRAVKRIYHLLNKVIPLVNIPTCVQKKVQQFTLQLKDDFILTIHLDQKLKNSEIEKVIELRKRNKVINYLYSEINSCFKAIVPIQNKVKNIHRQQKRDH